MPDWREMQPSDLTAVLALAGAAHPDHPEDAAIFAERLALHPAGCLVLAGAAGLAGYAVAHPWRADAPPALNTRLGALPAHPGAWHLHDIALAPAARGAGHAAAALRHLEARAVALGLRRATLVAVAGTGAYWARQGYRATPCREAAALASYGTGAAFLGKPLPG